MYDNLTILLFQNSIMEMPVDINDWQALGKLRHDGETKIECHPEPIRKR